MIDTKETIKKHGWLFQFVFDKEGSRQDFAYTIGLEETFNHPEIMIFGLPRETMHGILSDLVSCIREGHSFPPHQRTKNILKGGYEVIFKPLKKEQYAYYIGQAQMYYEKPFRTYVMFWPDRNNVLPIEEGCELNVQDEALDIIHQSEKVR